MSSLNEISTDHLGKGGGGLRLPIKLLDRYYGRCKQFFLHLGYLPHTEMGKHPDLLVAHPTSTIFTTIGRNYEIS